MIAPNVPRVAHPLTVGLLVSGTGTGTTELLGLAATGIGDEEGTVVLEEDLLELVLGGLIDVLLVVGNDGLGKSLTDSVDLGSVSTTLDADADVDVGELVRADAEDGLVDLELQDIGLNELNGGSVKADKTLAGLAVSNGSGGFLAAVALNTLRVGGHDE
jgi:hypothetical protein